MKAEEGTQNSKKMKWGKECAYLAVFVALLVTAQLCFSMLLGVELITVLCVSYAFVFGWKRGVLAMTAFSLLRQLVFGFYPQVLVLYLLYYNLLAFFFGTLGKTDEEPKKTLWKVLLFSCVGTLLFSVLDVLLNALWFGYVGEALKVYAMASLPVALVQLGCTAVSVGALFLPLHKAFSLAKKGLL